MQKDTTLKKIFVGGLPYHTTDESLKKFFEQFGKIEEAVVITDRQTGKSRGYGFVTMARSEEALMAIRDPNPCIDGRKANVNLAVLGAKPRQLPGASPNLFNPVESLPMPQGKFYPNMPVLNQSANILQPSFNGMNVLSNVYQNLAMKNVLLSQHTQQRQNQNQIPQNGLLNNGLGGTNDLLLNGNNQNSSLDYFNMLMSQNTAGQIGYGAGQNQGSLNQSQLNQLYMQLLNQNCPQMYQNTPNTTTTSSNNDTSLYNNNKAQFLSNNNTSNSFNNPLLDNSLVQFNLTGQGTTTTYQSSGTTELA